MTSNARRERREYLEHAAIGLRAIYDRFSMDAVSRYKWETEIEMFDEIKVENGVYNEGLWGVTEYGGMVVALQCSPSSELNIIGNPKRWRFHLNDGASDFERDEQDCVIIRDNLLGRPLERFVRYYSQQIYNTQCTKAVNMRALSVPFIVTCTEATKRSAEIMMNQIIDKQNFVLVDNEMIPERRVSIQPTGVVSYLSELNDNERFWESNLMSSLGISNVNHEKTERLTQFESESGEEQIQLIRATGLDLRKEAARKIQEKWGQDISVDYRIKEVQQDVGVYDTTDSDNESGEYS